MRRVLTVLRGVPGCMRPRHGERGSSLLEMSLLAPWFLFLFVGIVDMGFFTYDLISVENAARVAAEYTSSASSLAGSSSGACTRVLADLASLPNVASLGNCNSSPLIVSAASGTGPDGHAETKVTVAYTTNQFIPIPGLLQGKITIGRSVEVRVKP